MILHTLYNKYIVHNDILRRSSMNSSFFLRYTPEDVDTFKNSIHNYDETLAPNSKTRSSTKNNTRILEMSIAKNLFKRLEIFSMKGKFPNYHSSAHSWHNRSYAFFLLHVFLTYICNTENHDKSLLGFQQDSFPMCPLLFCQAHIYLTKKL